MSVLARASMMAGNRLLVLVPTHNVWNIRDPSTIPKFCTRSRVIGPTRRLTRTLYTLGGVATSHGWNDWRVQRPGKQLTGPRKMMMDDKSKLHAPWISMST